MVTKKFYKIILCLLLIMCVGCQRKEIKVRTIYSDIYTEEEIQEAIVLKTNFHTNYFAWKIGLNSNCDYEDYQWILIRNNNGKWKHVDGGYG